MITFQRMPAPSNPRTNPSQLKSTGSPQEKFPPSKTKDNAVHAGPSQPLLPQNPLSLFSTTQCLLQYPSTQSNNSFPAQVPLETTDATVVGTSGPGTMNRLTAKSLSPITPTPQAPPRLMAPALLSLLKKFLSPSPQLLTLLSAVPTL